MDLTYENNKGLYAFIMAFMVVLAVFLPTTSSYAATNVVPLPTEDWKVLKLDFKAGWEVGRFAGSDSSPNSFGIESLTFSNLENAEKLTSLKVYNATTKQDLSSSFLFAGSGTKNRSLLVKKSSTGSYEKIVSQGDVIQVSYVMSEKVPSSALTVIDFNSSSSYVSSSFFKTAPTPPALIQVKEVGELPGTLGKVAGIATLVGCLIFATLLAAGSVKRLISLFIR